MLNLAEHEISNAHKYKNHRKFSTFLGSDKLIMLFYRFINVKMPTIELSMKKVLEPRGLFFSILIVYVFIFLITLGHAVLIIDKVSATFNPPPPRSPPSTQHTHTHCTTLPNMFQWIASNFYILFLNNMKRCMWF